MSIRMLAGLLRIRSKRSKQPAPTATLIKLTGRNLYEHEYIRSENMDKRIQEVSALTRTYDLLLWRIPVLAPPYANGLCLLRGQKRI